MVRRPLGNCGLSVSALGLGTVKIGRSEQVKYPEPFTIPDDDAVRTMLTTARELGINLIDTAPAYGTSEERIGQLLPGRREDWVIVTKCGEEFEDGRSTYNFSKAHTRASVERSLRRLRTDYLDLVLIHSDGTNEKDLARGEAVGALQALRDEGKIRAMGLSTKSREGGLAAIETCDVLMVTLNTQEQQSLEIIRAAHAAGKGILIKKALASGHAPHGSKSADPVGEALSMSLREPGVGSVIVGTINPDHLRENAHTAQRILEALSNVMERGGEGTGRC